MPTRVETIAESFASYRRGVIPRDAPPVQVEECRRAFYAGAYHLLMNVTYNLGEMSDDAAEAALLQLQHECEAFSRSIGAAIPRPVLTTDPPTH